MAWSQNEQMSPIRDEGDKAKGKKGTDSWSDLVDENKSITGQASNMKPVSFRHQNSLEFDPSNWYFQYTSTHHAFCSQNSPSFLIPDPEDSCAKTKEQNSWFVFLETNYKTIFLCFSSFLSPLNWK